MLEGMWRRGNILVLLMRMQIDIATMEDVMEIPLKTKSKTTINSVQFSCSLMFDSLQFMDCNTPGFPVHRQFLEPTQTHVHQSMMPSNHLILCHPPSSPTFNLSQHQILFQESVLHIRWPKYWSFSFSMSPSNEYSGLISFRTDWFGLLAVRGAL